MNHPGEAGASNEPGAGCVSLYVQPSQRPLLSEREVRVLACVAEGMTEGQASAALGLDRGQVAYSLRAGLAKLGARTRAHAILLAIGFGYILVANEQPADQRS